MTIRLHRGDLPDLSHYRTAVVAVDTETMGLALRRDRLCVVQLSPGDGSADVVQVPAEGIEAPNLKKLLADTTILKIFHFGRFDLGVLCQALGVMAGPVYCTKIASRLARTYTDKHGLKDLAASFSASISPSSSSCPTGAPPISRIRRWPMRLATFSICTPSRTSSTRCWSARGATLWRRLFPLPPRPGPARYGGLAMEDIFAHS